MSAGSEASRPYRVAVVGGARCSGAEYERARALGSELAALGAVVLCGGHGGVMEAAARGATEAGGWVIGLLKGADPESANRWVTVPLATGLGDARNALVVRGAEAVVAVGGGWGTLSEIALARKAGLDVGALGSPPVAGLDLAELSGPAEAADWAVRQARRRRGETPA